MREPIITRHARRDERERCAQIADAEAHRYALEACAESELLMKMYIESKMLAAAEIARLIREGN